jgi:hypothetical protein
MNEIIKAIETKDWRSFPVALDHLVDSSSLSVNALVDILNIFPSIVNAFPEQLGIEFEGTRIIWYRYEMLIWAIGEKFRQVIKRQKELRKEPVLFSELEKVALDTQFGKGRESFVMLLGQYGGLDRVATLKKLLEDPEVQGHAVYALRLLGAPEVKENVLPLTQSPRKWIRNEAKKYFKKLEK